MGHHAGETGQRCSVWAGQSTAVHSICGKETRGTEEEVHSICGKDDLWDTMQVGPGRDE